MGRVQGRIGIERFRGLIFVCLAVKEVHTCNLMLIAALVTVNNVWVHQLMNEHCGSALAPRYSGSVLTPGYCGVGSGISLEKKREKMSFATTWINRGDIISSGRSQKYFMASLI